MSASNRHQHDASDPMAWVRQVTQNGDAVREHNERVERIKENAASAGTVEVRELN